ncbi:MAG TPA: CofH family radical SAM protein [Thermodesulfobium narugense]|uniref:De-hypoxanthine futalosine cyclase n=1 Tax=Thermodesulfobium acidiphilum TaxID=1794699 RepID=A0A2R4VYS8_THEAF|nr:CofH family radical SAM protein [Thermodesulfobium acidiphilum]AWB09628.1 de-hypoxanthine futalosine cyclase [Thermodesulfobium acidiphilum]PMP85546.1 MAG: dehypoxanthine futalosine cyclase [Thermodesulfobium narugense]HEM56546.1 CofH family radical SAM protein [Thermodesulfobium narugense]
MIKNRISIPQAKKLFDLPLFELAKLADKTRAEFGHKKVTYIIDRNINYSNVCTSNCKFCYFSVPVGSKNSIRLSKAEIYKRVDEAVKLNATQIMLQGGLDPEFRLIDIIEIFKHIKKKYPNLVLHSLSAAEIDHFSKIERISYKEVIEKLKDAGLQGLPGAGAEILVDKIRQTISPKKISSSTWLHIHRIAHYSGLMSTATMVIGFGETIDDRLQHLKKVRDLQDETGGFIAFIPWIFKSKSKTKWENKIDYLKTVALSRIFFDNIPNIGASWLTVGKDVAPVALLCGANDLGSVMLEENVVASAMGQNHKPQSTEELENLIKSAGFESAQRDAFYNIIK